jgi:hypothetical protein
MRVAIVIVLLLLPAGATAQSWEWPAPERVPAAFAARLSSLDPVRVESVAEARAALETGLRSWSPGEAEDAFRAFWEFYRSVVRVHDASIDTPELVRLLLSLCENRNCRYYLLRSLEQSTDPAVAAALAANRGKLEPARAVRRHGVEIIYGEGDLYRAEDASFLAELAAGLPARPFREFVEFYAREVDVWVYDAGIVIPWAKLGDRLARWETFARAHAALPETDGVIKPEVQRLREFYLCGVSNTPVYGFDQRPGRRTVNPEALASYKEFPARHPESDTAPIAREVVRRVAATNGVLDDALRAYVRKALNSDHTACER